VNRRTFVKQVSLAAAGLARGSRTLLAGERTSLAEKGFRLEPALMQDWLARWEKNILGERNRYCDRETGEELGWLVSPFLEGFYYGYRATGDVKWVERLIDWADSWVQRGTKEPDGFIGWPKFGTGGNVAEDLLTDSLLGEAMALRPVVMMSGEILKDPVLKEKFGPKAAAYVRLAESVFEKWIARGCWREVDDGGVWVVPTFGIDRQGNKWTEGYDRRNTDGFSNPANKQNHIACWLIAMYDVTKKPVYQDHARKWWQVMKYIRMRTREGGKYYVWNYWDPAGPWDYKPDHTLRHWVGVHPNGGYYQIDVHGIVTAFEHGLVFTKEDIDRLIATNRDFMWNQQVAGAKFQRIDGGQPDPRWKNSPGVLWTALVPYDETLRKIFLANHDPAGWGGLASTPWFLAYNHEIHRMHERTY
jgi:hypothetical protein